jgi:hypothetical protein
MAALTAYAYAPSSFLKIVLQAAFFEAARSTSSMKKDAIKRGVPRSWKYPAEPLRFRFKSTTTRIDAAAKYDYAPVQIENQPLPGSAGLSEAGAGLSEAGMDNWTASRSANWRKSP